MEDVAKPGRGNNSFFHAALLARIMVHNDRLAHDRLLVNTDFKKNLTKVLYGPILSLGLRRDGLSRKGRLCEGKERNMEYLEKFDVGRAIKEIRDKKGMTQGQIAKKNQWERSYISDLERGKIKNPSFDTILRLIFALGISCDEFVKAAYGFQFETADDTD